MFYVEFQFNHIWWARWMGCLGRHFGSRFFPADTPKIGLISEIICKLMDAEEIERDGRREGENVFPSTYTWNFTHLITTHPGEFAHSIYIWIKFE